MSVQTPRGGRVGAGAVRTGLAALYALVHVAGAHAVETRFWDDRRKAARRLNGGEAAAAAGAEGALSAGQRQLLAQLPAARQMDFRVTETVSLSGAVSAAGGRAFSAADVANVPAWISTLVLPHAAVRDIHISPKPGAPLVIHVQDAHGIEEAQRNVAGLVESLRQERGISLVGLEGAAGAFALDPYRAYPDPAVTKLIADHFLEDATLTGAEYAALTSPNPPLLWGVEDRTRYEENIRAFKDSLQNKPVVQDFLRRMDEAMRVLKDKTYSPALAAFDRHAAAYLDRREGLGTYVRYLLGAYPGDKTRFGNLRLLVDALHWEEGLDFKRVERDRLALVEALTRRLPAAALDRLVRRSLEYRAGRATYGDYYRFLRTLCAENGVPLSSFGSLSDYVTYVLLAERINRNALLDELFQLESAAQDALARTMTEKRLVSASRDLALLAKLTSHAMTPADWLAYQTNRKRVLAAPLEAKVAALGEPAWLVEVPRRPEGFEALLKPFESFCSYALDRNNALVDNLLAKMGAEKAPAAILVAGGFHTEGLTQALRRRDASYVVLTPKITDVPKDGGKYLDVFARDPMPLEKLFNGERINLVAPPVLNPGRPEPDPRQSAFSVKYGTWQEWANRLAKAVAERLGRALIGIKSYVSNGRDRVTVEAEGFPAPVAYRLLPSGEIEVVRSSFGWGAGAFLGRLGDGGKDVLSRVKGFLAANRRWIGEEWAVRPDAAWYRAFLQSRWPAAAAGVVFSLAQGAAGLDSSWLAPLLAATALWAGGQAWFVAEHDNETREQALVRGAGTILLNVLAAWPGVVLSGAGFFAPLLGLVLSTAGHGTWNDWVPPAYRLTTRDQTARLEQALTQSDSFASSGQHEAAIELLWNVLQGTRGGLKGYRQIAATTRFKAIKDRVAEAETRLASLIQVHLSLLVKSAEARLAEGDHRGAVRDLILAMDGKLPFYEGYFKDGKPAAHRQKEAREAAALLLQVRRAFLENHRQTSKEPVSLKLLRDNAALLGLQEHHITILEKYEAVSRRGTFVTLERIEERIGRLDRREIGEIILKKLHPLLDGHYAVEIVDKALADSLEKEALAGITEASLEEALRENPAYLRDDLISHLIRETGSSEAEVAQRLKEIGYGDPSSFRKLHERIHGRRGDKAEVPLVINGYHVYGAGRLEKIGRDVDHLSAVLKALREFVNNPESPAYSQRGRLHGVSRLEVNGNMRLYLRHHPNQSPKAIVLVLFEAKGNLARNETSGALRAQVENFLERVNVRNVKTLDDYLSKTGLELSPVMVPAGARLRLPGTLSVLRRWARELREKRAGPLGFVKRVLVANPRLGAALVEEAGVKAEDSTWFRAILQSRWPAAAAGLVISLAQGTAGFDSSWLSPLLAVTALWVSGQVWFVADHDNETREQALVRGAGTLLLNVLAFLPGVMFSGAAMYAAPLAGLTLSTAGHWAWNRWVSPAFRLTAGGRRGPPSDRPEPKTGMVFKGFARPAVARLDAVLDRILSTEEKGEWRVWTHKRADIEGFTQVDDAIRLENEVMSQAEVERRYRKRMAEVFDGKEPRSSDEWAHVFNGLVAAIEVNVEWLLRGETHEVGERHDVLEELLEHALDAIALRKAMPPELASPREQPRRRRRSSGGHTPVTPSLAGNLFSGRWKSEPANWVVRAILWGGIVPHEMAHYWKGTRSGHKALSDIQVQWFHFLAGMPWETRGPDARVGMETNGYFTGGLGLLLLAWGLSGRWAWDFGWGWAVLYFFLANLTVLAVEQFLPEPAIRFMGLYDQADRLQARRPDRAAPSIRGPPEFQQAAEIMMRNDDEMASLLADLEAFEKAVGARGPGGERAKKRLQRRIQAVVDGEHRFLAYVDRAITDGGTALPLVYETLMDILIKSKAETVSLARVALPFSKLNKIGGDQMANRFREILLDLTRGGAGASEVYADGADLVLADVSQTWLDHQLPILFEKALAELPADAAQRKALKAMARDYAASHIHVSFSRTPGPEPRFPDAVEDKAEVYMARFEALTEEEARVLAEDDYRREYRQYLIHRLGALRLAPGSADSRRAEIADLSEQLVTELIMKGAERSNAFELLRREPDLAELLRAAGDGGGSVVMGDALVRRLKDGLAPPDPGRWLDLTPREREEAVRRLQLLVRVNRIYQAGRSNFTSPAEHVRLGEPGNMPRLRHALNFVKGDKSIFSLPAFAAGWEAFLAGVVSAEEFKKTWDLYKRSRHAVLQLSVRDPRQPGLQKLSVHGEWLFFKRFAYKYERFGELMKAFRSGFMTRLKRHFERHNFALMADSISDRFLMAKYRKGDEVFISALVKGPGGKPGWFSAAVEFNNFNAFNKAFPPDAKDSVAQGIFAAILEDARTRGLMDGEKTYDDFKAFLENINAIIAEKAPQEFQVNVKPSKPLIKSGKVLERMWLFKARGAATDYGPLYAQDPKRPEVFYPVNPLTWEVAGSEPVDPGAGVERVMTRLSATITVDERPLGRWESAERRMARVARVMEDQKKLRGPGGLSGRVGTVRQVERAARSEPYAGLIRSMAPAGGRWMQPGRPSALWTWVLRAARGVGPLQARDISARAGFQIGWVPWLEMPILPGFAWLALVVLPVSWAILAGSAAVAVLHWALRKPRGGFWKETGLVALHFAAASLITFAAFKAAGVDQALIDGMEVSLSFVGTVLSSAAVAAGLHVLYNALVPAERRLTAGQDGPGNQGRSPPDPAYEDPSHGQIYRALKESGVPDADLDRLAAAVQGVIDATPQALLPSGAGRTLRDNALYMAGEEARRGGTLDTILAAAVFRLHAADSAAAKRALEAALPGDARRHGSVLDLVEHVRALAALPRNPPPDAERAIPYHIEFFKTHLGGRRPHEVLRLFMVERQAHLEAALIDDRPALKKDVLEVFVPVLEKRGLVEWSYRMKDEMLRITDPAGYQAVLDWVEETYGKPYWKIAEEFILRREDYQARVTAAGYEARVLGRVKSIASIHEKLDRIRRGKEKDLRDLVGFQIVFDKGAPRDERVLALFGDETVLAENVAGEVTPPEERFGHAGGYRRFHANYRLLDGRDGAPNTHMEIQVLDYWDWLVQKYGEAATWIHNLKMKVSEGAITVDMPEDDVPEDYEANIRNWRDTDALVYAKVEVERTVAGRPHRYYADVRLPKGSLIIDLLAHRFVDLFDGTVPEVLIARPDGRGGFEPWTRASSLLDPLPAGAVVRLGEVRKKERISADFERQISANARLLRTRYLAKRAVTAAPVLEAREADALDLRRALLDIKGLKDLTGRTRKGSIARENRIRQAARDMGLRDEVELYRWIAALPKSRADGPTQWTFMEKLFADLDKRVRLYPEQKFDKEGDRWVLSVKVASPFDRPRLRQEVEAALIKKGLTLVSSSPTRHGRKDGSIEWDLTVGLAGDAFFERAAISAALGEANKVISQIAFRPLDRSSLAKPFLLTVQSRERLEDYFTQAVADILQGENFHMAVDREPVSEERVSEDGPWTRSYLVRARSAMAFTAGIDLWIRETLKARLPERFQSLEFQIQRLSAEDGAPAVDELNRSSRPPAGRDKLFSLAAGYAFVLVLSAQGVLPEWAPSYALLASAALALFLSPLARLWAAAREALLPRAGARPAAPPDRRRAAALALLSSIAPAAALVGTPQTEDLVRQAMAKGRGVILSDLARDKAFVDADLYPVLRPSAKAGLEALVARVKALPRENLRGLILVSDDAAAAVALRAALPGLRVHPASESAARAAAGAADRLLIDAVLPRDVADRIRAGGGRPVKLPLVDAEPGLWTARDEAFRLAAEVLAVLGDVTYRISLEALESLREAALVAAQA